MSYRFVKLTTFYPTYLKEYYLKNSEIKSKNYSEQYQHIMADAFGWANFYQKNLQSLGVEAFEIITNAEPLQQAWAQEHGVQINKDSKVFVIEQLKALKPDVVLFQDTFQYNGEWITWLKEQIPSIKQIIGWCCAPYTNTLIEKFRTFDYMLTCIPSFVSEFSKHGIHVYQINHAFEESLLPRIYENNNHPETDFIFIGSLIIGNHYHNKRIKMIESLLYDKIDLRVHSSISSIPIYKLLAKQGIYALNNIMNSVKLTRIMEKIPYLKKAQDWHEFPRQVRYSQILKQAVKPQLFGIEMLKACSKTKIGFNIHADVAGNYACNIRLFELTGVGSCLVTDHKKNIRDFFEPDKEIVTYKNLDEAKEKIKWLIEHPKEREQIAKAGQQRTLKDHTFAKRAEELNEIINKEI